MDEAIGDFWEMELACLTQWPGLLPLLDALQQTVLHLYSGVCYEYKSHHRSPFPVVLPGSGGI